MGLEDKYYSNKVGTIRCTDDNIINPVTSNQDKTALIQRKSVENDNTQSYKDPSILILLVVAGIIFYEIIGKK